MQLTNNFSAYVTKDESHFAVMNIKDSSTDGGYGLGERAFFEDQGVKYSVTILRGKSKEAYEIDLQKIQGE